MNNFCTSCGARLPEGTRICPNCGKLIPAPKQTPRPAEEPRRRRPPEAVKKQRPKRPKTVPMTEADTENRPKHSKRYRVIRGLIITAVVLAAVYFSLFGLQVLRIRHSSYDFESTMKLSCETYGEAFDRSVEDGSWSYDPFRFEASYTGIHDGKSIKLVFSALVDVKVKYIEVGGEKKDTDKQKETYLMGLFI